MKFGLQSYFHNTLYETGYVISEKNVNDVIEILGAPEDISEEETQEESTKSNAQKKLYRDTDERIIGGVASGLGHYFGIDRVWIRLILIILVLSSIGGVVFVYILLWALIPEAKTTSEKLRMRGEPVNISNIEKKIKEGLDDVTQKVKSVDYSKVGDDLKKKSIKFSEMLEKLILLLVSIASKDHRILYDPFFNHRTDWIAFQCSDFRIS